jgi:Zn-dependent protease
MGIFSQWGNPEYWLSVLYSLPAVLLALSFHECAHAYAAYKCGDPTARNLGRLTLDPTKHLDLWGTVCLIFFRFGWAKPVPISPRNFKHARRDHVIVSLAGIIANFILSFIAYAVFFIVFYGFGLQSEVFYYIMYYIILLNITLGIFNVLPIPPLDGFQLLTSALVRRPSKAVAWLNRYGFIILIVLLISGALSSILQGFSSWLLSVYGSFFGLFF